MKPRSLASQPALRPCYYKQGCHRLWGDEFAPLCLQTSRFFLGNVLFSIFSPDRRTFDHRLIFPSQFFLVPSAFLNYPYLLVVKVQAICPSAQSQSIVWKTQLPATHAHTLTHITLLYHICEHRAAVQVVDYSCILISFFSRPAKYTLRTYSMNVGF